MRLLLHIKHEIEINTRAFSLFKMENDLAISEMRRFILQHHLRSAQMERFVARISFKVADLDRGTGKCRVLLLYIERFFD